MFDLLDESGGGPHTLLLLFVIDFVRSWNEALVSWAGGASATDASGAAGASKTAFNSVYSPMVVHASHCSAQTDVHGTGNPTSAEFFNEVHSDND